MPTVSGRLSFKIVGESRYPTKADYANVSTTTHQYVLVSQVRNLSDVLFEWLVGPLLGISGKFRFFFIARMRRDNGQSDASLVGRVYVARRYTKKPIDLLPYLERFRPLDGAPGEMGRSIYKEAGQHLEGICDISANVVMNRDGTVCISKLKWHDPVLQQNSLANPESQLTDLNHSIADQIYFFLRDITHQHQHHGADADTIIQTQQSSGRDLKWANNIVYGLYLYMINAKRRGDSLEHVRVLGVLAYVKAFKQIIAERAFQRGMEPPVPVFNDSALTESVNATRSYIELLQTKRRQGIDQARTVLFAVVAALFSLFTFMASFAEPTTAAPPLVVSLANTLKANAYFSATPLALMLIWWLSTKMAREHYDFKRDALRLALVARGRFIAISLVGALVLAYVAFRLVPTPMLP